MRKTVVILQNNRARAEKLVSDLALESHQVLMVESVRELQGLAARLPIQIGVLDLDLVSLQEVARLRLQLGMQVVCTHRVADEAMWTDALDAGALDCCFDDDAPGIGRAIGQLLAVSARA